MNPPVRNDLTETLVRDATNSQRVEIEHAITENAAGVHQLASRILNDSEIHNPIACFLTKLRAGAHLAGRARTDGSTKRNNTADWDPALAAINAERARAYLAARRPQPASLDADDDIPGYGEPA